MAEGVFRQITHTLPSSSQHPKSSDRFMIDSAGTGAYHALSPPDPRTMKVLEKNGITTYDHSARKLRPQDFVEFDYIFGMDAENVEDINEVKEKVARDRSRKGSQDDKPLAKVALFGSYGGKSKNEEVEDPYYGGGEGFNIAFEQLMRFSKGFLASLEQDGK